MTEIFNQLFPMENAGIEHSQKLYGHYTLHDKFL